MTSRFSAAPRIDSSSPAWAKASRTPVSSGAAAAAARAAPPATRTSRREWSASCTSAHPLPGHERGRRRALAQLAVEHREVLGLGGEDRRDLRAGAAGVQTRQRVDVVADLPVLDADRIAQD